MAKEVFDDPFVSINGVDLSDHVESMTLNYSVGEVDLTSGSGETARGAGFKDWSADITFRQDFAAGEVDATIFSIVGTQVAFIFRPDIGVKGATNPEFTGNGIIFSYQPIGGTVGDAHNAPVSIMCSDGAALARATS